MSKDRKQSSVNMPGSSRKLRSSNVVPGESAEPGGRSSSSKQQIVSTFTPKYKYPGITTATAYQHLESLQMYASRRGELKLFGLISDSKNEMERIMNNKTDGEREKRQTDIKNFFHKK